MDGMVDIDQGLFPGPDEGTQADKTDISFFFSSVRCRSVASLGAFSVLRLDARIRRIGNKRGKTAFLHYVFRSLAGLGSIYKFLWEVMPVHYQTVRGKGEDHYPPCVFLPIR